MDHPNEPAENSRAENARAHDDKDLIESMEDAPAFGGRNGGNLQRFSRS